MNRIDIKGLENRLLSQSQTNNQVKNKSNKNFEEILGHIQNRDGEIKFSKHAISRMDARDMRLNNKELDRLNKGFTKAEEKGVKDALIIMGDKAFIASIKNKTIITTINREQMKENVFTNIDGAVIV